MKTQNGMKTVQIGKSSQENYLNQKLILILLNSTENSCAEFCGAITKRRRTTQQKEQCFHSLRQEVSIVPFVNRSESFGAICTNKENKK